MATPSVISDNNSGVKAKVTKYGQLVTSPLQYSTPVTVELDLINTAFNFIRPAQDQSIVITDIIVGADKNVSNTTPADVAIYSSDEFDSLTVVDSILAPQLLRSANLAVTGLNLLISEGLWVNATTDDASIRVTIMFYRIPAGDV